MAVKRRNVWLSDEVWAKLDAITEGRGSRSQVIAEMVRITNATTKLMGDPNWAPNVGYHTVPSGQSRRREDQEKIQALSGPPTLAETRRMRAAAAKAFGQFRPAPKPGKR